MWIFFCAEENCLHNGISVNTSTIYIYDMEWKWMDRFRCAFFVSRTILYTNRCGPPLKNHKNWLECLIYWLRGIESEKRIENIDGLVGWTIGWDLCGFCFLLLLSYFLESFTTVPVDRWTMETFFKMMIVSFYFYFIMRSNIFV